MRPLRVVQLLPALAAGGVERSTLEIAEALVAAGHASHVVSAGGRLVPALEAAGSLHHRLAIGAKSLATPFRLPALRRLLRELRPDIVHARSRLPAWMALTALRGLQPRPAFVTTVHGLNSPGIYSSVMTRGDAVIGVSETVRAHVLRHWPEADGRLVVIPRGIDPAGFPRHPRPDTAAAAAVRAELGLDAATRLLLMPGRGTRLKGHGHAVRLLAALRGQGRDVALWLLGAQQPGREAYLASLQAEAAALGVGDRLRLSAPRSEVVVAYAGADLVLQLSDQPEAFGRTVLEALSVGVPVLGWTHGGVGEILERCWPQGAVPLGDAEALASRAGTLLDTVPPLPAVLPYPLSAMQSATLELYARLAD
ncbi:glycosyltransferase [Silanimonas sp.]|uniref:glycosyltransferase n=1 Tax=Silanimonas sp. TaxID=1929290 RepID=UPI001BC72661|nr:glycosyltransferase [Silanimonas sp.]MBS3895903.1 glycosyltransferase [Silanimonas sp.]